MTFIYGALAALAFFALFGVIRMFFRVEEGHAAIVTSFGRPLKNSNGQVAIIGAGVHTKMPWQRAHEFSVMERDIAIREEGREVELLARDGTLLRMEPQIRFQFRPEYAENFVFGIKRPLSHLREVFRSVISSDIGSFGTGMAEEGSYSEIRRQRGFLHAVVNADFQKGLDTKYGIQFKAAEISEILPPAELAQALNSVSKVEAENRTLIARIQADCEQRIEAAKHGVYISEVKAEAVEKEIQIIGEALTQLQAQEVLNDYLKRRRDEATSNSKTLYLKT